MKTLNKILIGALVLASPLFSSSQINSNKRLKEIKSKLGAETFLDIKYLGNGYYTKNDLSTQNSLSVFNALQQGEIKYDGKRVFYSEFSRGYPTKSALESIDDGDYIITPKEINEAINNEYVKSFDIYAQNILNTSKENIVDLEGGYKTSKELEEAVKLLADFTKKEFSISPEVFYNYISKDDAVLTKEEIQSVAKSYLKYLEESK